MCMYGVAKDVQNTFLILTDMFRRYIRHRQCDGYESLQLIKRACYNVQYINLKLTKLIDARARIYRESVRLMCLPVD